MDNSKIKAGITVFPGSNCDFDVFHVLANIFKLDVSFIWHKDEFHNYNDFDFIVIPGGFSYGDYLRAGALAARSRVLDSLKEFAERGGIILGICNGFQILLESGLLDGVMLSNRSLRFECGDVYLRTENNNTPFTCALEKGTVLKMPIAHHDGNYFAPHNLLDNISEDNRIIFKYSTSGGEITDSANPNGSLLNIAGISNKKFNVLGLMPHPERSSEEILGSCDGGKIFKSIIKFVSEK